MLEMREGDLDEAMKAAPSRAEVREMAMDRSSGPPAIPAGFGLKNGPSDADVQSMVRAMRRGTSWEEVCHTLGARIRPAALAGWKDEILRQASVADGPVLAPQADKVACSACGTPLELFQVMSEVAIGGKVVGRVCASCGQDLMGYMTGKRRPAAAIDPPMAAPAAAPVKRGPGRPRRNP